MNLTDDFILKCQRGTPVFLKDICAVYPSKLGEIVDTGYDKFNNYLQTILIEKPLSSEIENKELREIIKKLTDYEFFLMMTSLDPEFNISAKAAFRFFTHENAVFSLEPAQIIIGPLQEKHIINEEDFLLLRRIIKKMFFLEVDGDEIVINPDDNARTKQLKLQMIENRKKVAKAKAKKKSGGDSKIEFSDLVGSVALAVSGLNMINIWDLTYYSFQDQLKRMGWHEKYYNNMQAALAGAKMKNKQLEYWMKSISSNDN